MFRFCFSNTYIKISVVGESINFCFRSSKGTNSYCSSTDSGSDSCTETIRDISFYVKVLAYSGLSNAKLAITGGNIASVEEVDEVDQTTISPTTLPSVSKYIVHYLFFKFLFV